MLEPFLVGELEHRAGDILQGLAGAMVDVEAPAPLGQHRPVRPGEDHPCTGVPEVDSDEDAEVGGEPEARRRAPPGAGGLVVALHEDTVRDELADGARHRGDGEAGPGGDVAAGDGTGRGGGRDDRLPVAPLAVVHGGTLAPSYSVSG